MGRGGGAADGLPRLARLAAEAPLAWVGGGGVGLRVGGKGSGGGEGVLRNLCGAESEGGGRVALGGGGWRFGGLEGWRVGGLEGWRVGGLEGWRVGGLEGWRVGGLEGWRVGGLEGWRVGGLEGWRVGGVGWVMFVLLGGGSSLSHCARGWEVPVGGGEREREIKACCECRHTKGCQTTSAGLSFAKKVSPLMRDPLNTKQGREV